MHFMLRLMLVLLISMHAVLADEFSDAIVHFHEGTYKTNDGSESWFTFTGDLKGKLAVGFPHLVYYKAPNYVIPGTSYSACSSSGYPGRAACSKLVDRLNNAPGMKDNKQYLMFNDFGMLVLMANGQPADTGIRSVNDDTFGTLRAEPSLDQSSVTLPFWNIQFAPSSRVSDKIKLQMTNFYQPGDEQARGPFYSALALTFGSSMQRASLLANYMTFFIKCDKGTQFLESTGLCMTMHVCGPGTESALEPDFIHDRNCVSCPNGKYNDGTTDGVCKPHSQCNDYQTEGGQYQLGKPSGDTNRICEDCGNCPARQFEKYPCQFDMPPLCQPWRKCPKGTFFTQPPAANTKSDATCAPCPPGHHQPDSDHDHSECPVTKLTCDKGERQDREPWVSWDRGCVKCTIGETFQDRATINSLCNLVSRQRFPRTPYMFSPSYIYCQTTAGLTANSTRVFNDLTNPPLGHQLSSQPC